MIQLSEVKRVLTFFAHPDDETLAAGGTLSKLTGLNIEVHAAIPATGLYARQALNGSPDPEQHLSSLRNNCRNALSILGIPEKNIVLGNLLTMKLTGTRCLSSFIGWRILLTESNLI